MLKFRLLFVIIPILALNIVLAEADEARHSGQSDNESLLQEEMQLFVPIVPRPFYAKNSQKLQNETLEWFILDSLANAYSFYSNEIQPLMYDKQSGTLALIKRGVSNDDNGTPENPDNTKNNLFLLESDDMGQNWTEPVIMYDKKLNDYGDARYPSISPFYYDGTLCYAFTSPVTDGGFWMGFLTGFFSREYGSLVYKAYDFNDERGDKYYFESTGNGVLGYSEDDEIVIYSAAACMPPEAFRNKTNQGAIGVMECRLAAPDCNVPDPWHYDRFYDIVTEAADYKNYRSSSESQIKRGPSGKWYNTAVGMFKNDPSGGERKWKFGVSVSDDKGLNWSEYNICPYSLIEDFFIEKGLENDLDSCFFSSSHISTVITGENEYSVLGSVRCLDRGPKDINESFFVEFVYDGENWSMSEIAEATGFYPTVINPDNNNPIVTQTTLEMQLCITEDNSKLLAKWTDFYDWYDETGDSIVPRGARDVYTSFREIDGGTWSEPVNVTNSQEWEIVTWIPDVIPSNLENIPLIRTRTILRDAPEDRYAYLLRSLEEPQYVLIAYIDADPEPLAVKENITPDECKITGIYPNPANEYINVNCKLTSMSKVSLIVKDIYGNTVFENTGISGNPGLNSFHADTRDLPAGNYFCTVTTPDAVSVKPFIVVR